MYEQNACSLTSEPSQSSSRCVSSFKNSSVNVRNVWRMYIIYIYIYIYTYSLLIASTLLVVNAENPKIYVGTQSKCSKRWKQSSAIKQLLETLFLAIKMCTGFIADGICMNTMCAMSLANHLRAVADAFRPLTTHQRY